MRRDKRSPLKDRPLRNPGQSVDNQLMGVLLDKFLFPGLVAVMVVALAAHEWWRHLFPQPPTPWFSSVLAALIVIWAGWRIYRSWPEVTQLRLARNGEMVVGQYLERLRERGYQVFHDVLGSGFNVDHVLIGPAGIFTIETKTFSKRSSEARVYFDGEKILVDGIAPDRDPVVQCRAQCGWLRSLLEESTGRKLPVRGVILFPGWYVENPKGAQRETWVLEPKALPSFLEQEGEKLKPEDVKLASFHLSRFVRTVP